MPGDQRGEALDDMFIELSPGVNAVGTHLVKQLVGQVVERIGRLCGVFDLVGSDDDVHVRPSLVL